VRGAVYTSGWAGSMGGTLRTLTDGMRSKYNAEARKLLRGAEACGCRRMEARSGVPAICFAGTQGSLRIDAPLEDVSEQIELAS
jgi:hypothetical protein